MTDREPIAVFGRDWKPAVWGNVFVLFLLVTIVAVFVRGPIASALKTGELVGVLVVSLSSTLLATIVTAWRHRNKAPVAFYRDHVAFDGTDVPYEDIAVAIHEDADGSTDALGNFGTGRFALFVPGGTDLRFDYVQNPGEVERVLADNISAPADQLDDGSASGTDENGREYITDRGRFWNYWRADRQLPETAVIDGGLLETVLEVDSYNLELLDRVDMTDAEGLSNIDQSDVTFDENESPRHHLEESELEQPYE
ncbi:hypothetical protein ACFPM1_09945 [Halorubrum rubrum]|uniref:PH domain-containing protein n=1 Tax=Halorubrum rubrum TaxID=1126240 RepID=A0ABD5R275_9EURY|nr:hypothetical protein [Halorubrum rubrum]